MAATGLNQGRPPLTAFLILWILSYGCCAEKTWPNKTEVEDWADEVDNNLRSLNQLHSYVHFSRHINRSVSYPDVNVTVKTINGPALVQEMADTLSVMLGKKKEALRKTVKAAEDAAAVYPWKEELQKDDVTYENSKELNKDLVFEDRFEKDVNYNFSSVHIPVEIYDGNIEILNGLNWTAALDEQFKKNAKEDPEILWQYFGSQSGFMRTYPATPWPRKGVDLYDVRRQSWYTQGSSSPKDMMILIDKSGSTHGQSLQLMQNAVKSILDTLGENDFVNIVEFSTEANFVSRCFNHTPFVQANYRNKKQLERDVDRLQASGQADFSNALKFAFEKFQEFSTNETYDDRNIGADCNKVIMLLTDGGTDNAEDVFKEYNWPNKTVRVFTYAVGPTPNPVHAIRWMACANRGYFSQIPAMGAIRARVQNYTSYLKETMEVVGGKDYSWEVTNDPRGLGMMTTVTLPVYNSSLTSSNQTILGVVGIDVTTAELEARSPHDKIGPNGYSFAINPNGYVVFHPNLKTSGKYMTEPPNVDILDLEIYEGNTQMDMLRQRMINRQKGSQVIETLFLSPDQRYVTSNQADYSYTYIDGTTFSLGLCIPVYQKEYYEFGGDISKFDWSQLNDPSFKVLIAPWNYHKNMTKMKNLRGYVDDIISVLHNDPDPTHYNLDLLYHLYWDTKLIDDYFKKFNLVLKDTLSSFVMTSGGMTFVKPASEAKFFEDHRDPRKSSLYTRAQHSTSCILMADYTQDNTSTSNVTVACAVSVISTKTPVLVLDKPAVVGQRFSHDRVLEVIQNSINGVVSDESILTCEDDGLVCYVLDNGGFLVAGNLEDKGSWIGGFIGMADPTVFDLLEGSVYSKVEQYDFQSTCKKVDPTLNAGFPSFRIPSINLLFEVLNLGWWSSQVSWALTSFNLYSWMTPEVTVFAEEEEDFDRKCVKAFQQYYIKKDFKTIEKTAQCKNCTRRVTAVRMKRTGSLFVVADPPCDECDHKTVSQAPREVLQEEAENIVCEMAQAPRPRKRSYSCYHSDPREDSSQCGCQGLQLSFLAFGVVLLSIVWQWVGLTQR